MAPDTARSSNRPLGSDSEGAGIPLLALVLSGALRIHPPEPERSVESPRDG